MLYSSLPLLFLGLAVEGLSIPRSLSKPKAHDIWPHVRRQANISQTVLPMYDDDPAARAQAIHETRLGFLYGPSPVGNTSFYPAGPLGNASITSDFNLLSQDAATIAAAAGADVALAAAAVQNVSVEYMCIPSTNSVRLAESTTYLTMLYYTMANGNNQFRKD